MNGLVSSSHVLMQITRSFTSAVRIQQVLETKIDITDPTTPVSDNNIKGEVEFKSVYFSYSKNGEYVLKDISFHVNSGETIGIIGQTGSGKSTLIKLLPRLYDPDLGEVLINGINIKEYTIENLRESIGFVPQNAKLFAGSIAELSLIHI